MAQTYEKMIKIDEIADTDTRNALLRLVEVGVTPSKIFINDSKSRLEKNQFFLKNPLYSFSKGNFLYDCEQLAALKLEINKFNSIYNKQKKNKNNKDLLQEIEIYTKII